MADEILRVAALCLLLAGTETLHGIARAALLVPRVGKRHAQRIGIVTGSLLAFAVCAWQVPSLGIRSDAGLAGLGVVLASFMATFDALLGRLLLKRPWRKVLDDFNPATGNYLLLGLLYLAACPWLVSRLP